MERYLTEFDTFHLPEITVETVVVGSGIAGLSTALQLINLGEKPLIITKKPPAVSNSFLAQGGIAAAIGRNDDPQNHYRDTLKAGRGLCIRKNVRILVEEGLERVVDLINNGVHFDRDNEGNILLTREGGHSKRRVLHVKDRTGSEIGYTLYNLVKDRAEFLINYYLEEILTEENRYIGLLLSDGKKKVVVRSKSLVIATGGYSPIYLRNTSAYKISGDTLGVAYRAGCVLSDLEFVQFHPTAIHIKGQPAYLITEAIRGEGALLVDEDGNRFIDEMRPRDEVARAIFKKYSEGKKVFLDLRPLKEKGISIKNRFPTVYSLISNFGFSDTDLIPVSPAAHYSIGGIQATANGKTSVDGIFAVGEASCTGIHGANRLASNSLLECITFGYKTAYAVYIYNMYTKQCKIRIKSDIKKSNSLTTEERRKLLIRLKKLMWDWVGLERSESSLSYALEEIEKMEKYATRFSNSRYIVDLIYLSKGIILSAKNRKESRGTHYRSDFPQENRDYKKHTKVYNDFKIKLEVN
ncbi:L-aspartate oxidase [Persephonella atlantica]|uniref:L-aspartate oxidase n=1 Tax=Persephonella atlantica TaxID=2699429 RepID=A0ABS1GJ70_9AQUI|nr:L-aspartate oxidase [Persephonella atlantica]MBK3332974.1 L-aspartate oxidase [Persephonella atlantica]